MNIIMSFTRLKGRSRASPYYIFTAHRPAKGYKRTKRDERF